MTEEDTAGETPSDTGGRYYEFQNELLKFVSDKADEIGVSREGVSTALVTLAGAIAQTRSERCAFLYAVEYFQAKWFDPPDNDVTPGKE